MVAYGGVEQSLLVQLHPTRSQWIPTETVNEPDWSKAVTHQQQLLTKQLCGTDTFGTIYEILDYPAAATECTALSKCALERQGGAKRLYVAQPRLNAVAMQAGRDGHLCSPAACVASRTTTPWSPRLELDEILRPLLVQDPVPAEAATDRVFRLDIGHQPALSADVRSAAAQP
mmetsp:Transcript_11249/g.27830  ORF Transcript_11249/g.27830 Transcript_11249/m.27830 type:complete len:173 (+) Transcript_11249:116-634(+)